MSVTAVDRIVLAWPTHLAIPSTADDSASPSSWMQVAKTGAFVSARYGKFSITKDDLKTMLHNFTNITPKPPTQLPVDYDHLSMDPKKPGDGVAAGWIQKLELRENGDELWAEVKWTPDAAEKIKNKEYQFVSPSFVKDYVYKDGKKIGTTLLAAAITNHPFLEGMKALTIYNNSALGEHVGIAVPEAALLLMETGQRVTVKNADPERVHLQGVTLEIAEVVGEGDDAFVSLKDEGGVIHKWFRADQLGPAMLATPFQAPPNPDDEKNKKVGPDGKPLPDDAAAAAEAKPGEAAKPAEQPKPGEKPGEMKPGELKPGDTKSPEDLAAEHAEKEAKKALAGIVGVAVAQAILQKGMSMSQTFKLSTTGADGKPMQLDVTAEQLEKAGIKIVPDNAVVVEKTAYDEMNGKVTTLSTQVAQLMELNATNAKSTNARELATTLDSLSKAGRITKPMREWAAKTFKDTTDLAGFREWVAALPSTPLLKLDHEHGSGADDTNEPNAGQELLTLANSIVKEKKISLREAVIEASAQRPDLAESYRERFDVESTVQ